MWVPSLLSTYGSVQENGEALPTGLIFSSFMLAMTLGGGLFNILHRFLEMRNHEKTSSQSPSQSTAGQSFSVYYINVIVFAVSGVSMCVPLWYFEFWPILISFFVLECMLGELSKPFGFHVLSDFVALQECLTHAEPLSGRVSTHNIYSRRS